ncbi:MAG: DUF2339 domain-containing protein [Mobilicoccus sp.]|nr:DUF2339 domain-containing protein [Mobilicoccus sp.]
MNGTTAPDPVDALRDEVRVIRQQLDDIGHLLIAAGRRSEAATGTTTDTRPWATPAAKPTSQRPEVGRAAPRRRETPAAAPTPPAAPTPSKPEEPARSWDSSASAFRPPAPGSQAGTSRSLWEAFVWRPAPGDTQRAPKSEPTDAPTPGARPATRTTGATAASASRGKTAATAGKRDSKTISTTADTPAARPPKKPATPPATKRSGPERDSFAKRPSRFTPERMLAVGGAVVTILGVGFLLAVAIASGLFGPVARVSALGVLALALAVVARRQRRSGADAAVALAATSSASAFGVVVGMTAIYGWIAPLFGVIVAMALAAGGIYVAHRWRSAILAGLVYAQCLIVLPFAIGVGSQSWLQQYTLYAVLPYLALLAVITAHRWMHLFSAASGALLLIAATSLVLAPTHLDTLTLVRFLAALGVFVLVSAAAAGLSSLWVLATALTATVAAVLWLGYLPEAHGLDVAAPAALAVIGAVAAWRYRDETRALLGAAACLHLVLATTMLPVSGDIVMLLIAVESLALLLAARHSRSVMWWASLVLGAFGVAGMVMAVPPTLVMVPSFSGATTRWDTVLLAAVVTAIAAVHVRRAMSDPRRRWERVAGSAVALYGVGATIVAMGTLPGAGELGAMGAGVVTTMVWLSVAVALILRPSWRRLGYFVLAVAIVKLFFADLHAVDGILRAVLFVITGLVLIAASSLLRNADKADKADPDQPAPTSPTQAADNSDGSTEKASAVESSGRGPVRRLEPGPAEG